MNGEASVVARKLENFYVNQHDYKEVQNHKKEPGIITNMTVVCLMSLAIFLTKSTLFLTKLIKKLEGKDSE